MGDKMNKDIVFYSNYDNYSKKVLNDLSKLKIDDKLIYICVDDENIQLPKFLAVVPTLYLVKEQSILVDDDIEKWIENVNKKPDESSGELDAYFNSNSSFSSQFSNLDDTTDKVQNSVFSYISSENDNLAQPKDDIYSKGEDTNKNYETLQSERQKELQGVQRI
jgi:PKD repeat protein